MIEVATLSDSEVALGELCIGPHQQFRYKPAKGATNSTLIMDAMEFLLERSVDGFCIVSSDSDFIGLAARIREKGLPVYGFGLRMSMRQFVAACSEFVFTDEADVAGE